MSILSQLAIRNMAIVVFVVVIFVVSCAEPTNDSDKSKCLFSPVALLGKGSPKFFTQDEKMSKRQKGKIIEVLDEKRMQFESTDQGLFLDCNIVQNRNLMYNISLEAGLVPHHYDLYFGDD